jgi:hypothetical protein
MTTSAELATELVGVGGDLDHLAADLETGAQLVDARGLGDLGAQEVPGHEQLTSESICLTFARLARAVRGIEEVMAEFVGDRKALPHLRLAGEEFDPVADQTRAEAAEVLDLDDLESNEAGEFAHPDWWRSDGVFVEYPACHRTRMRRVCLLGTAGSAGDPERIVWRSLFLGIDQDSQSTALRALIGKARRLVETRAALFLGAPEIRHARRIDYRLVLVHPIGNRRGPQGVVISARRRDVGRPQPREGATMDKKESKLFEEVERLRGEDGLGAKLDRYRRSRGRYERLVKGHEETAPSVPLQRSRRQATAHGRIRGIVDGAS